ncbi:MAG: hypothetical protein ACW99F_12425 [Candidatus Hodarchaeales archaeon]|jgi:hypothetical protein
MSAIWEAKNAFEEVALKKMKPAELFSKYRSIVGEIKLHRQRLKNPINLRNGEPLSASTITNFEKKIEVLRKELTAFKEAIRLLITCGFLTKRFKRTETGLSVHQRFVRSIVEMYVMRERQLDRLIEERNETITAKKQIKFWREQATFWQEQTKFEIDDKNWWKWHLTGGHYGKNIEKPKQKCKRVPVDHQFQIIDGGKLLEKTPPFAN